MPRLGFSIVGECAASTFTAADPYYEFLISPECTQGCRHGMILMTRMEKNLHVLFIMQMAVLLVIRLLPLACLRKVFGVLQWHTLMPTGTSYLAP